MIRKLGVLILALLLATCEPYDYGPAPTISGVLKTPISQSQIQLTWSASGLGPDTIEKYNLKFGIWVAKHSDGLNTANLGSPNFTTGEGALSYTLTGLTANTEYDILVRATIGGGIYSESTDLGTQTRTLTSGGGVLGSGIKTTLTDQANKIISGKMATTSNRYVGMVNENSLQWYKYTSGGSLSREASLTLNITGLQDAAAVPVTSGQNDHLFAMTKTGMTYYTNGTNLTAHAMTFGSIPVAGTFVSRLKDNLLDVFSYVGTDHLAYIYTVDSTSTSVPFLKHTLDTGGQNPLFSLAKLNNDVFYDVIYFRDNKLYVALGKSSSVDFEDADLLDTLTSDDLGEGSYLADMFVVADENGAYDIFLLVRNEGKDLTRLISYQGNGDGTFATAQTTDYSFHFYYRPTFTDVGGDGRADLVVAQTSSNNVAVYFGPSTSFSGAPTYYGIDGVPYMALAADVDGQHGPDLVVYDKNNKTVSVLYDNN